MTRIRLLGEISRRIVQADCKYPIRVAIDGVDAAGKTALADELTATLGKLGRSVLLSYSQAP